MTETALQTILTVIRDWLGQNAAWIGPLATCVTLAGIFWRNTVSALKWLLDHRPRWVLASERSSSGIPGTHVTFIEIPHRIFWHMGARGTEPSMQIVTEWYATNASGVSVRLLGARLIRPNPKGRNCHTISFMILRETNSAHGAIDMPISPQETGVLQVSFFLDPPTQKEGTALRVELAVMDQYRHEHRTPEITIAYR